MRLEHLQAPLTLSSGQSRLTCSRASHNGVTRSQILPFAIVDVLGLSHTSGLLLTRALACANRITPILLSGSAVTESACPRRHVLRNDIGHVGGVVDCPNPLAHSLRQGVYRCLDILDQFSSGHSRCSSNQNTEIPSHWLKTIVEHVSACGGMRRCYLYSMRAAWRPSRLSRMNLTCPQTSGNRDNTWNRASNVRCRGWPGLRAICRRIWRG
jgi:hypothetical protein